MYECKLNHSDFNRRWYPEEPAFRKKLVHRALEDIRESIDEMKFYRTRYFKSAQDVAAAAKADWESTD